MADPAQRLYEMASSTPAPRLERVHWLERRFVAADLSASAQQLVVAALMAACFLVPASVAVGKPVMAAAAFAGLVVLPFATLRQRKHRRSEAIAGAVPPFLDALARSMRAGTSLLVAQQHYVRSATGPLAAGLAALVAAVELGQPLDDAWAGLAARERSEELAVVAALVALLVVGESGGAQAFEDAGRALRLKAALRREVRALVAQAELSMRVLVALPAGFVALGLVFGNEGSMVLFTTRFGRLCLVVGIALELIGAAWMRSLLRRAVR